MRDSKNPVPERSGSAKEVFLAFLRLGCTSFGGPVAHLGYFRNEFVARRQWCTVETFAEIVALCQAMPGPASSQVAFTLGLLRARWRGGLAAWAGFTLPSALLMMAFELSHHAIRGKSGTSVVHGLQLVAVAVVAQAVLAMQRTLAPDWPHLAVALAAGVIAFFAPASFGTLAAIGCGVVCGWFLFRAQLAGPALPLEIGISRRAGWGATIAFLLLLAGLPVAARLSRLQVLAVFSAFFSSGALVFGGGHVVLPLLDQAVVARGWVDQPTFLAGYGAAQAVPGPLFTFAAFLGAAIRPSPSLVLMSALALIAIFLPGLLLVVAVLPFWSALRQRRQVQASLRGVNAGVVGILAAALIRPVSIAAIHSRLDFLVALSGIVLLTVLKLPPWVVAATIVLATYFLG
jgi:chromate transporter